MSIEITGDKAVLAKLFAFGDEGRNAVERAVKQTAVAAAAYARKKAPSGDSHGNSIALRQSITSRTETDEQGTSAVVYTTAPHAQYVELGTGWPVGHNVYTMRKSPKGKVYRIKGWVYPRYDGTFRITQGMPPRPFMRPARSYAARLLKTKLESALKELMK